MVGLLRHQLGFHLQIHDVGSSIPAGRKMAEKGSPEPVSAAGGYEEDATRRRCCRKQLKKTIWFNSHFSNPGTYRKGEWGVQEITGRSELRGKVFQTAHAPPCLFCQVARSKGRKAPGTSWPQPTVLWKPAPLLGSHCLHVASRGQHRPTLQSDPEQTRLAGLTLQSGIQGHIRATSRALHTPG